MSPGIRTREVFEAEERERLAPWAICSGDSRGRVVPEPPHAYRSEFQRDRDRVIHARAFRRLQYKTQVFVYHEGDHYRNRLTHTIEAAQITRTLARALRLNEDLAEAIVLAHDLGHTPFGHAGEHVLNDLLRNDGGFDHNRQSLRVVDLLEERYPDFRGLNLTQETRAGMLKHGCAWEHPLLLPALEEQPSLEAQVADLADEIAYVNHDLDDGLRAGILDHEGLADCELWNETSRAVQDRLGPQVPQRVFRAQVVRALIDRLVSNLLENSASGLARGRPASADAAQKEKQRWIGYSATVAERLPVLKRFLFERFYQHPRVVGMNRRAERVLRDLYAFYRGDPARLPEHVRARFAADGAARATADYIAGMTDRFAETEHRRWCGEDGAGD